MPNVSSVTVVLTLSTTSSGPPYNMASCSGTITYDDGTSTAFTGWNAETMGNPIPSGASFTLTVVDSAWSAANESQIAGWALTFLPRAGTSQASPFGNNINTITGGAVTTTNGSFALPMGNNKIKNGGDWDWALMAQMSVSNVIHCFASDPEMEVDT